MNLDWGPWIEHDGNGIPGELIGKCIEVQAEQFDGSKNSQIGVVRDPAAPIYRIWDWRNFGRRHPDGFLFARILRYRIFCGVELPIDKIEVGMLSLVDPA